MLQQLSFELYFSSPCFYSYSFISFAVGSPETSVTADPTTKRYIPGRLESSAYLRCYNNSVLNCTFHLLLSIPTLVFFLYALSLYPFFPLFFILLLPPPHKLYCSVIPSSCSQTRAHCPDSAALNKEHKQRVYCT